MSRQKEQVGEIELDWSGELTVRRIAALRDEVRDALQAAAVVRIRLEAEAEIDTALLQLLCSAHRTAVRAGKTFFIVGQLPEQITGFLRLAGFHRHIGCCLDETESCIWKSVCEQVTAIGSDPAQPACV